MRDEFSKYKYVYRVTRVFIGYTDLLIDLLVSAFVSFGKQWYYLRHNTRHANPTPPLQKHQYPQHTSRYHIPHATNTTLHPPTSYHLPSLDHYPSLAHIVSLVHGPSLASAVHATGEPVFPEQEHSTADRF